MTEPAAEKNGQTFRDTFEGSLTRPTTPLTFAWRLALSLLATIMVIFIFVEFVPDIMFSALRDWWAGVGTRSGLGELNAVFSLAWGPVVTTVLALFAVFTLAEVIADLRKEAPLRRLDRDLVVIRELTQDGVGYREGDITTVHVPWSQVQELRSMDLPSFEGKLFFVVELKSPIHDRGRLVFWDGQDRYNSIAGRLRERLATYRAAQAAAG
jgi:hypothetical protein